MRGHQRGLALLPCSLVGARAIAADTGHAFARHTHDEFGVGLIIRGAHASWSGRGRVEAGAGDVITVNPGEVHDGAPIGASRRWHMLYFAPSVVLPLLDELRGGADGRADLTAPVVADRRTAQLFARTFASITAASAGADEGFVTLIRRMFAVRIAGAGDAAPAAIARARARIEEDPAGDHALDDLAREAGIGRFVFLRAFSRATGLTPHAYVMQRRIELARRLIGAGTPLAEAAAAAGFADQSHMTRRFVAIYGLTPAALA